MEVGKFYFLKERYFIDFQDINLMKNKEIIDGVSSRRPFFYSFQDLETMLFWLIPVSSIFGLTSAENKRFPFMPDVPRVDLT